MTKCAYIAHRGASVEAPENTLSAFNRALSLGVDGLECDVHLSKDGVVMLSHDASIPYDWSQDTHKAIADMDVSEIANYDVGGWFDSAYAGERVPTLEQLLAIAPDAVCIVIELKGSCSRLVHAVIELLRRYPEQKAALATLDSGCMRELQQVAGEYPLVAVATRYDACAFSEPFSIVAVQADYLSQMLVDQLHKRGKKVWVWTVDSVYQAERFRKMLVDGIITNDPRALQ